GGSERFLETDCKSVLIAAGDQGDTRRCADGGICVGLKKPHAVGGEPIDVRRVEGGPAVTRNVGVTEIVGEDERGGGGTRRWQPGRRAAARRDGERPGCRLPQQCSTGDVMRHVSVPRGSTEYSRGKQKAPPIARSAGHL